MDIDSAIKEYQNKIFKYCYQMLRNKEDAEEALQEVFLKFYTCKDTDKLENPCAFLYKIAHNHCINIIKKQKLLKFIELDLTFTNHKNDVENDILNNETKNLITRGLNCLSAKDRSLVILRIVEEKSYDEISKILGKNENTLRKQFYRARNKIKEFIIKENGGRYNEENPILRRI